MANVTETKKSEAPKPATTAAAVKPAETAPKITNEAREARKAELQKKMSELAIAGKVTSPEFQSAAEEFVKLSKPSKASASLSEEEKTERKNLETYLSDGEKKIAEGINTEIKAKFPKLATKGISVVVSLKVKGFGRVSNGNSGPRNARIVHLDAAGKRVQKLNQQGIVGMKQLGEAYPKDFENIKKILGTAELRNKLWAEAVKSGERTNKAHITLSDGTKLALQS